MTELDVSTDWELRAIALEQLVRDYDAFITEKMPYTYRIEATALIERAKALGIEPRKDVQES